MSDCLQCGRWAPDDPETGPDPSDLCPECVALDEQDAADEMPEIDEEGVA